MTNKMFLIVLCCLLGTSIAHILREPTKDGFKIAITRGENNEDIVLQGTIGKGIDFTNGNPPELTVTNSSNAIQIIWSSKNTNETWVDCFDLRKNDTHWYGGPERHTQTWPIENMQIRASDRPWVLVHDDNFAVIEPYFLNSKGAYLHVAPESALYIDMNNLFENQICFIGKADDRYVGRDLVLLNYTISAHENPREAHLHAVNNILGKPTGHPNEKMIREPIWTTWAKYKKDINDSIVVKFAQDIVNHGYNGQLEIDDNWETCYGAQEFDTQKFGGINDTVKTLHDLDFRVTLWIHPFVDNNCKPRVDEGLENGYFVKDTSGNTHANWWNSGDSNQIDFTNTEAQEWFLGRLRKLKELHGIDSFKFDAGETDYVDQPAVYPNVDINLVPNVLSSNYLRTVAKMGDLIEVRSAWKTQDLPVFVRMLDKDSHYGFDNGLKSLVTTLLQMNLNGHVMVLPDMIGGNGYNGAPNAELLVRWAQANVFMPAMQFSYLPWEITSDEFNAEEIVKKTVELHTKYSDLIIEAMEKSIENGTPVNPPIWWIDPENRDAHGINDEYLLGENILVAPILDANTTSRDIFLPTGNWTDGNQDKQYVGPITLTNYPAPIDVLPYFIKEN